MCRDISIVTLVNELFWIVYKQFQGLREREFCVCVCVCVYVCVCECGTNMFGASHLAPTKNDIIVTIEVCDAVWFGG